MNREEMRAALEKAAGPVRYGALEIDPVWLIDYLDGKETDGAEFIVRLVENHQALHGS